jgi:hypothetical protein
MTDQQRLMTLLTAERYLKATRSGYDPDGPNWKAGMPRLWKVRQDLGSSRLGQDLAEAHGLLKQTEKGYDPRAPRWSRAMRLIDGVEEQLRRPPVPDLGPVIRGDKSLLLWAPTHNTDGLGFTGSDYPAFDSGWEAGLVVIAPERMRVTRQSSAQGADAFYASGVSTLDYWVGHIDRAPITGAVLDKGDRISQIAHIPGVDHLHWGIDARRLIGRDLRYGRNGNGPDYTFGSPTIGRQLALALAV